jgi:hypothetical protein
MIFAFTSFAMFAMLSQDRAVDDVCKLVKSACRSTLAPLLTGLRLQNGDRLSRRKPARPTRS